MLGICPEAKICYPKISNRQVNELTNGHTHFFMIGNSESGSNFEWGDESRCKYELAQRIAKGRISGMGGSVSPSCKMLTVVIGDNEQAAIRDIEASLNARIPIVVIRGSPLSNQICDTLEAKTGAEVPRH